MTTIEMNSGASGKRLLENVSGGMYRYQRELWRNIAVLNWCWYWTQKVRTKEESVQRLRYKRNWTHEHKLVGRKINVISTKNMAGYLNSTIERLCLDQLGTMDGIQFTSSWAVAFREGIADRVIEKVVERRNNILEKEKAAKAKAERDAAKSGVSLSRVLTVASLNESEEAGNYDFLHGEGAWAKKKEREAEWERDWAKRREERAKAEAEAERLYSEWASEHPAEAAEEARKEAAKARAANKRAANRRPRYRFRETKEEARRNSGGYFAGYEKGEVVSIDQQVESDSRRIGHG